MRLAIAVGVLCLVAAPASAVVSSLQFDVTSGSMQITFLPGGAAMPMTISSGMVGSFDLDIEHPGSEHIGNSAFVSVADVDVSNTATMVTTLAGVATATMLPGSVRFSDFLTAAPGHLMGGVATPVGSSYIETTILVEGGSMTSAFSTNPGWGPSPLTVVTLNPPSSLINSDIVTVSLDYGYVWLIGSSAIAVTLTLWNTWSTWKGRPTSPSRPWAAWLPWAWVAPVRGCVVVGASAQPSVNFRVQAAQLDSRVRRGGSPVNLCDAPVAFPLPVVHGVGQRLAVRDPTAHAFTRQHP